MNEVSMFNFNGKLACDFFVHIDVAEAQLKIASNFPIKVKITEEPGMDNYSGISFEAELIAIERIENIFDIPSVITMLSHGIDKEDFLQELKAEGSIDSSLAWYIYKKIK